MNQQKIVSRIKPLPTIEFTIEDRDRLREIYDFIEGLQNVFRSDAGYSVECFAVNGLLRPGYERCREFFYEIHDRFKESEAGQ